MPPSNVNGPPAALISRVDHLVELLKGLPQSLPLNPTKSTYNFGMDLEDVQEEGYWYAFNRNMEVCFQTYKLQDRGGQIEISERGKRFENLTKMFKRVFREDPSSRDMIKDQWLERVIKAAITAGAKVSRRSEIMNYLWIISVLTICDCRRPAASSDDESPPDIRPKRGRVVPSRQPEVIDVDDVDDLDLPALIEIDSDSDDGLEGKNDLPRAPNTTLPKPSSHPPPTRRIQESHNKADTPHDEPKLRQASLGSFGWKKLLPEEIIAQNKRGWAKVREEAEVERKREEVVTQKRLERKREEMRKRVQKHRSKVRKDVGDHGHGTKGRRAKEMVLHGGKLASGKMVDLEEISRPGGKRWKAGQNGKNKGAVEGRHQRTNWYHPFLWTHINDIAPRVAWSPTHIARTLQRNMPRLFSNLYKGTVEKWLSKHHRQRWSKRTLKNVENHSALAGTGRVGVLTPYPEIVEEIKSKLIGLRTSGVCVNRLVGRSIMLAVIQKCKPELLETFKVSEVVAINYVQSSNNNSTSQWYVGSFFASVLNWTERKGTRAAAHIPENADKLCQRMFFRIVHLVNWYDIPLCLLINMDQLGIILLLANNTTYHDKGFRQVNVMGKDEKRAYTLCVASTAAGDALPFQQVWSGKTKGSLPKASATSMDEATANGFHFAFADSPKKTSHFSTLKTMKEVGLFIFVVLECCSKLRISINSGCKTSSNLTSHRSSKIKTCRLIRSQFYSLTAIPCTLANLSVNMFSLSSLTSFCFLFRPIVSL